MGCVGDFMGFNGDLMVSSWDLKGFIGDLMEIPSVKQTYITMDNNHF